MFTNFLLSRSLAQSNKLGDDDKNPVLTPSVNQTVNSKGPLPEQVFFDMLFNTVLSMDKQAAKLEAEGKSGDIWGKYFERHADLTESQVSFLRKTAQKYEEELKPIQKRAMQIISEQRKARSSGQPLLAPSEELKSLQSKRDAASLRYGKLLQSKLGVEIIEKLRETFRQNTDDSQMLTDADRQELSNQMQRLKIVRNSLLKNQSQGGQEQ